MKLLRRDLLKTGLALSAGTLLSRSNQVSAQDHQNQSTHNATGAENANPMTHGNNMSVGTVDPETNGFDPMQMLVDWDYGQISALASGQILREYNIVAVDKEIEIIPGVKFPAWTYNGRVPGPTIRATEGDRLRINFVNGGSHPHTIHFHGIHPAEMDGTALLENGGEVQPGDTFTYEFDAEPFGCHLYHCHAVSLKRHIHKGLYGAFIIDPKEGRPPAREFMMLMNGFDTNFDSGNEVYAVNTVAFEFANRPIPLQVGELVRIYLVNILEFDLLNSFHLHANFFDYYDHGTSLTPTLTKVDTISQVQGQRGILEFRYKYPGKFMFHPHVSEFTELGWMGLFNVVKPEDYEVALSNIGLDESWNERALNGSTVTWKEIP